MNIKVYLPTVDEEVVFKGSMTEILGRMLESIKAVAYDSAEDVKECLVALQPEKGHNRLNKLYCDCLSAYRRYYVNR